MERLAIIARLKPDTATQAAELIAAGPPFAPQAEGFERHSVYLSATEVMFVFEGHEVDWLVDALIESPFKWIVSDAFDHWRPLIEGRPRIAREKFFWRRDEAASEGEAVTAMPPSSSSLSTARSSISVPVMPMSAMDSARGSITSSY